MMNADEPTVPVALRIAGLAVMTAGAAGSLLLMFRGQHPPPFLALLFIGWVLSPFIGLITAEMLFRPFAMRVTLYVLALLIALTCFAAYARVIPMPKGTKPAAVFLIVPLMSWLLMAIVIPVALVRSRRGR